eukprot:scaffold223547_cov41-Prasinocladus_malaysianus.AAC.1
MRSSAVLVRMFLTPSLLPVAMPGIRYPTGRRDQGYRTIRNLVLTKTHTRTTKEYEYRLLADEAAGQHLGARTCSL